MGKTNLDQAQVDCVLDTLEDIQRCISSLVAEPDNENLKKIREVTIPKILDFCEKIITANTAGKGFLVGQNLTLADLALFTVIEYPMEMLSFKLDQHQKVAAHRKKVSEIPRVADYLKKRQKDDELVTVLLEPALKQCSMKHYKLTYFTARARGELTRLAFAASGIEYEDNRIKREDWPSLKPSTPQGQLPLLEVDGVAISQSLTIARFVGKRGGLMGENKWDQAQIEMVMDNFAGLLNDIVSCVMDKDEAGKTEKKKKLEEEAIPKILSISEKSLTDNSSGKGFLVGSSLSMGDLALYNGLQYPVDLFKISLDKYPKVAAHRKKIAETPKIAEWLKKRPETEF